MTQLPAKVLIANRLGDRYLIAGAIKREKYSGTGNAKAHGKVRRMEPLSETSDVIRRFDRDTEAFAALVVSAVVSAALVFAVLVQDHHPKMADITEEPMESEDYFLLNDNLRPGGASLYEQMVQMNSGQATSVDHVFNRSFDKKLKNRTVHAP